MRASVSSGGESDTVDAKGEAEASALAVFSASEADAAPPLPTSLDPTELSDSLATAPAVTVAASTSRR